jgi:hypothetical protein
VNATAQDVAELLGTATEVVRELEARGRLQDLPLDERVVRLRLFEAHWAWATRRRARAPRRYGEARHAVRNCGDGHPASHNQRDGSASRGKPRLSSLLAARVGGDGAKPVERVRDQLWQ